MRHTHTAEVSRAAFFSFRQDNAIFMTQTEKNPNLIIPSHEQIEMGFPLFNVQNGVHASILRSFTVKKKQSVIEQKNEM